MATGLTLLLEERARQVAQKGPWGLHGSMAKSFPVSDHCDGSRFFNPVNHINWGWRDVLRWKRHAIRGPWPKWLDIQVKEPLPKPTGDAIAVNWINHCSFLLQTKEACLLVDPVYSRCAGPWGVLGPPRVHAPGIDFDALPRVTHVLLSHDHYDHCDLPTLRRLARRDKPVFVTPLGNGGLGRRAGFERIVELDWWQDQAWGDMRVTLTRSRHWSNRISGGRNGRLWGGFHIQTGACSVYFSGDTGFEESIFQELRSRLGSPDLSLLPIGAYLPRWFMSPQHCSPEEAVRMHQILESKCSVAMHWGCWNLADDGREEGPAALKAELQRLQLSPEEFRLLEPGEGVLASRIDKG